MSRIVDNQHHPADVVAGMVLGVVIAVMYIMRAVPRYRRVLTMKETQASLHGGVQNDEELCIVETRAPPEELWAHQPQSEFEQDGRQSRLP